VNLKGIRAKRRIASSGGAAEPQKKTPASPKPKKAQLRAHEPSKSAKQLAAQSGEVNAARSTGLGAGAGASAQFGMLKLSREKLAPIVEFWKSIKIEEEPSAAPSAAPPSAAPPPPPLPIANRYADFESLDNGEKLRFFGASNEVEDRTDADSSGHATRGTIARVKKEIGAKRYTALLTDVREAATTSAEAAGNGRVRVYDVGLDWYRVLEKNGETWMSEVQVSAKWSDRHNSDRDVWLNVHLDRDNNEIDRYIGHGH
jgi:hypothetical protein